MKYSDEILCAFIDGELESEKRDALLLALEKTPELRGRLDRLKKADSVFRQAIDTLSEAEMPESVLSLLKPDEHFDDRASNKLKWLPMAACLLATTSIGFGYLIGQNKSQAPISFYADKITHENPIFKVLEKTASSERVLLKASGDLSVEPLLSFISVNGQYCRQYHLTQNDRAYEGLACKDGQSWKLVAWGLSDTHIPDAYQTASGTPSPAIEAAVDALIEEDVLSSEAELRLIRDGWK
jgi:hypothetical protein